jgi:hypothetical protein
MGIGSDVVPLPSATNSVDHLLAASPAARCEPRSVTTAPTGPAR